MRSSLEVSRPCLRFNIIVLESICSRIFNRRACALCVVTKGPFPLAAAVPTPPTSLFPHVGRHPPAGFVWTFPKTHYFYYIYFVDSEIINPREVLCAPSSNANPPAGFVRALCLINAPFLSRIRERKGVGGIERVIFHQIPGKIR